MASIKNLLFHAFLLASLNIILGEEENSEKAGLFGLPDMSAWFPGFGSGMGFGNGMGIGNTFEGRNSEANGPSDDAAGQAHEEGDDHHNRLFFSLASSLTTCNYTLQAGSSCISCRQSLTCLPSNVGLLRTCRGLFRYCNNGYCSLFQGSACTATTAAPSNSTG